MKQLGGCYCGVVRYVLSQEVDGMMNCHCRNCRRANGGAFTTVTPILSENFEVTEGEAILRSYETATGFRYFCGECGGRMFSRPDAGPELTVLLVSTLDNEPTSSPRVHLNTESKAPWYEILDDLPQFASNPAQDLPGPDEGAS